MRCLMLLLEIERRIILVDSVAGQSVYFRGEFIICEYI
jgi:hypothetical protein